MVSFKYHKTTQIMFCIHTSVCISVINIVKNALKGGDRTLDVPKLNHRLGPQIQVGKERQKETTWHQLCPRRLFRRTGPGRTKAKLGNVMLYTHKMSILFNPLLIIRVKYESETEINIDRKRTNLLKGHKWSLCRLRLETRYRRQGEQAGRAL